MSHIKSGPNSGFMQLLALTTAATMAFSAVAQTTTPVAHPFVTNTSTAGNNAVNAYRADIIKAAKSVAKDDTMAIGRTGLFGTMLEARLASLPEKFSSFSAPKEYTESMFQLHGMTPTSQFINGHATMCAAQDGKVLGAWKIYLAPTTYYGADGKVVASFNAGQVVPRQVVPNTPEQIASNRSTCFNTLRAAVSEIQADHALAVQQAQASSGQAPAQTSSATPAVVVAARP